MKTKLALFDDGPPPLCPERFNMAEYVLSAGRKTPKKTALEVISSPNSVFEKWSYEYLTSSIQGSMTGLRNAGIRAGDRVFLRLNNSPDFPVLFFAVTGIGALPVPISPMLTDFEIDRMVADVDPKAICLSNNFDTPAGIKPIRETEFRTFRDLPPAEFADTKANDPAYLIFTSGTGGKSKAVVHAHRAAFARQMMWRDWYDLNKDDRVLHAGAFNWSFTLGTGLTDPWAIGATALIYTGKANKSVWSEIANCHNPTLFAAAPGVYRQLLAGSTVTKDAYQTLRHGLCAGDYLPETTRADWIKQTGKPIYSALGMSEISTYISECPHHPRHPTPQYGRRVCILENHSNQVAPVETIGRLAVSTGDPGLMLGYWNDAAKFELPRTGEWFATGDLAQMSAEGQVTHQGRQDDLLNAQGYRVSAHEVEKVFAAHADVEAVAVLALEVKKSVEILAAFVVGRENLSVDSLKSYCREYLADYKVPKEIKLLPALPRTATGKILKRELKREFGWKGEL